MIKNTDRDTKAITHALLVVTAIVLILSYSSLHATPTIFFGEDLGLGESARLSSFPNSSSKRKSFEFQLQDTGTATFESFPADSRAPLNLSFPNTFGSPVTTATLHGNGFVNNVSTGTNGFGRYPTSGNQYWETGNDFQIKFSRPVSAFGFSGIDIGDFQGQVTVTTENSISRTFNIANTKGAPGGSALFWGLIDTENPFISAQFGNTAAGVDFFGFDDMTVGTSQQVASSLEYDFPLRSQDKIFLHTESGGACADSLEQGRGCFDRFHAEDSGYYALDLDVNSNDKADVVAANAGILKRVSTKDEVKFGPAITIQHKGGYFTEYREFHLDQELANKLKNRVGKKISSGEKLGELTGRTSEHLHFQVKFNPKFENGPKCTNIEKNPYCRGHFGTGLSTKFIPNTDPPKPNSALKKITLDGRPIEKYELKREGNIPKRTQVFGPNLPKLPRVSNSAPEFFGYEFNVGSFSTGIKSPIFIDPEIAIGYDYKILSGPPLKSVTLPDIGDGLYEVWGFDKSLDKFVFNNLIKAGVEYNFEKPGLESLRILGIEPSARLDPNDPTAFAAGFTFMKAGSVEMRQTPISQRTSVPTPKAIYLFGIGLAAIVISRHFKNIIRS